MPQIVRHHLNFQSTAETDESSFFETSRAYLKTPSFAHAIMLSSDCKKRRSFSKVHHYHQWFPGRYPPSARVAQPPIAPTSESTRDTTSYEYRKRQPPQQIHEVSTSTSAQSFALLELFVFVPRGKSPLYSWMHPLLRWR
ncbi:hypothetical protein SDC9_141686 [bioreactor metagenome]|uniref:Uncharacterized protein n=1 Tax=bioreactor metagenome TaxID=1076179 RepID=A0A645DYE3_9ZZZZ